MDAAEIARLRIESRDDEDLMAVFDALEQARKERDLAKAESSFFNTVVDLAHAQRDQAQQSAKDARALAYEECAKMAECGSFPFDIKIWVESTKKEMTVHVALAIAAAIRARIEAMLEQKP